MQLSITKTAFNKVSSVKIPEVFYRRMKSGVAEFDHMFGEGLLPGSTLCLTAGPGMGKSTLMLQLTEALTKNGYVSGYASGEESVYQLAYTCERLGVKSVQVANETDVDQLVAATKDLDILIIDSLQALSTKDHLRGVALEQYVVSNLIPAAKRNECVVIFIVHLTKNGKMKGSTLVPHSVDANFQILADEDGEDNSRIISFHKNRYGACLDISATLTPSGFEIGERRSEASTSSSSKKGASAKALKAALQEKILALDPPLISKSSIMQRFDLTGSQAYMVLKELQDMGKLIRYGRGDNACFKKNI